MLIPIGPFDRYIDDSAYDAGKKSFEEGRVKSFVQTEPGCFKAIVEDTEEYAVSIKADENYIKEFSCTCLCSSLRVCSHVAAVIKHLQLREDERLFIKRFRINLTRLKTGVAYESYASQVRDVIIAAQGKDGTISFESGQQVFLSMRNMIAAAEIHLEKGNLKDAVNICIAMLKELTKTFDLSEGGMQRVLCSIHYASGTLKKISMAAGLPEDIRKYLFEACLDLYDMGLQWELGWEVDLLHIAAGIAAGRDETVKLIRLLYDRTFIYYDKGVTAEILYLLMSVAKDKSMVEKCIEENLGSTDFRETAIKWAIDKKDYKKASNLALDGVKLDSVNNPANVWNWYKWLKEIAMLKGDKEETDKYLQCLRLSLAARDAGQN